MNVITYFNLVNGPQKAALIYRCQGCKCCHVVNITKDGPTRDENNGIPVWTWNGSFEKPTIRASVLSGRGTPRCCHHFITDGNIQFLGDCAHEFAGKTLPMEARSWMQEEAA